MGSIPAHAGEPCHQAVMISWRTSGLSPRMRGNPSIGFVLVNFLGSIPAHAGEPGLACGNTRRRRVYPRACGGTAGLISVYTYGAGLSPRMRGNPRRQTLSRTNRPTGLSPRMRGNQAGNYTAAVTAIMKVYPRACGGTSSLEDQRSRRYTTGLSPRMRGNHGGGGDGFECSGSIPAHAGEPPARGCCVRLRGVYPRACGGT